MSTTIEVPEMQREAWDKITGPGLYNVFGDRAFYYICNRIKRMIWGGEDLSAFVVMGADEDRIRFLKQMAEEGCFEWSDGVPLWEPWFFCPAMREAADGEKYPANLNSEDVAEWLCEFIRHSKAKQYHRVGGVVILGQGEELKHVDKVKKVPVLLNGTTSYTEVPIFNVCDTDGTWWELSKETDTTQSGLKKTLVLIRADEVEEESVQWLVPEFIPLHAATVFSGQMDTLKSTLAIDIAAALSCWRPWFMGDPKDEFGVPLHHEPAITLFAGSEDKFESTVLPRYKAAGGNPDCLYKVGLEVKCEQRTKDGMRVYETPFDLDEHIGLLQERIQYLNNSREWRVGLLVCDPLITLFGNKNYCSPQDANDLMIKVKKLCEEERVTVLSIAHYNKTQGLVAKDKTSGAKRIVEAHRQAWGFDRAEGDSETTIVSPHQEEPDGEGEVLQDHCR